MLIPFEDKTFENTTIILDGKFFLRCTFKDCTILYTGGEYELRECQIGVVVWEFKSSASRTVELMKAVGMTPGNSMKTPE